MVRPTVLYVRVAVGTPVSRRPRTDPYVKDYFIRLLPWVGDDQRGMRSRSAISVPNGIAPLSSPVSYFSGISFTIIGVLAGTVTVRLPLIAWEMGCDH